MPKDHLEFHPLRFQLVTAALDVRYALDEASNRAEGLKDTVVSSKLETVDFAGMSEAEFRGRLHLMTEMREVWSRWSTAGSEVLDFSDDMARLAGSKTIELPWDSPLTDLYSAYVHFGAEAELALPGQNRVIEGAYLETADAPNMVMVRYVCNDVYGAGSLADALIAQSEVIAARFDRTSGDFIDFFGDPALVSSSPRIEMASRTLFVISQVLGPSVDPGSSPSRLPHRAV